MFRGVNALSIDAKGRIAVPSRYRDQLRALAEGRLVITIHTDDPCLWLYPQPEWEQIEANIARLPAFNATATKLRRLLVGYATDVELDGNGRLLLPPLLREHASLDKKVMLVGQGTKFELWDEATWNEQRDNWLSEGVLSGEGEELSDELKNLVL